MRPVKVLALAAVVFAAARVHGADDAPVEQPAGVEQEAPTSADRPSVAFDRRTSDGRRYTGTCEQGLLATVEPDDEATRADAVHYCQEIHQQLDGVDWPDGFHP